MGLLHGIAEGIDKVSGFKIRPARVDLFSHALEVIDSEHEQIHDGNAFELIYSVPSLGAMTTPDDMITLDWTTPNTTEWAHFQFSVYGSAGWRVRLIEAPTGGAASPTGQLVCRNRNRNSTGTSSFTDGSTAGQVNYDSTLATGGITLWDMYLPGGFFSSGMQTSTRNELVLKQNTKYQLSLYGTDTNPATLGLFWYEYSARN